MMAIAGASAYFVPNPVDAGLDPCAVCIAHGAALAAPNSSPPDPCKTCQPPEAPRAPTFFGADGDKSVNVSRGSRRMQLIHGLIADCVAQVFGGFFAIVGLGLGIVIIWHGIDLKPMRN
jgi:hypothetical protein